MNEIGFIIHGMDGWIRGVLGFPYNSFIHTSIHPARTIRLAGCPGAYRWSEPRVWKCVARICEFCIRWASSSSSSIATFPLPPAFPPLNVPHILASITALPSASPPRCSPLPFFCSPDGLAIWALFLDFQLFRFIESASLFFVKQLLRLCCQSVFPRRRLRLRFHSGVILRDSSLRMPRFLVRVEVADRIVSLFFRTLSWLRAGSLSVSLCVVLQVSRIRGAPEAGGAGGAGVWTSPRWTFLSVLRENFMPFRWFISFRKG